MLAIREAARKVGNWRLTDCCIYVTLEPCPMCAGAISQARLGKLVFGAFDEERGCAGSLYRICEDPAFPWVHAQRGRRAGSGVQGAPGCVFSARAPVKVYQKSLFKPAFIPYNRKRVKKIATNGIWRDYHGAYRQDQGKGEGQRPSTSCCPRARRAATYRPR